MKLNHSSLDNFIIPKAIVVLNKFNAEELVLFVLIQSYELYIYMVSRRKCYEVFWLNLLEDSRLVAERKLTHMLQHFQMLHYARLNI